MQSRVDFLQQTIEALESVEKQVAQLKFEVKELHSDCVCLTNYGIATSEEMDNRIVETLSILDELVDSFDNILAKPGDDIKTQRETDYRYSVRKDAKTVKAALAEQEQLAAV